MSGERFEVTVWDHEGDIVKKLWDATHEEAEEVREQYVDDPFKTVVVQKIGQGASFGPPRDPSPRCESGKRPHCTCDICF